MGPAATTNPEAAVRVLIEFPEIHQILMRDISKL
jgi:hypothetical protein